jgi:hypothetical protein
MLSAAVVTLRRSRSAKIEAEHVGGILANIDAHGGAVAIDSLEKIFVSRYSTFTTFRPTPRKGRKVSDDASLLPATHPPPWR